MNTQTDSQKLDDAEIRDEPALKKKRPPLAAIGIAIGLFLACLFYFLNAFI